MTAENKNKSYDKKKTHKNQSQQMLKNQNNQKNINI